MQSIFSYTSYTIIQQQFTAQVLSIARERRDGFPKATYVSFIWPS